MPAVSAQLNDFIMPSAPRAAVARQSGTPWYSRVVSAFQEARTRQAEREIARLITLQGGRLTDSIERDIERHFV